MAQFILSKKALALCLITASLQGIVPSIAWAVNLCCYDVRKGSAVPVIGTNYGNYSECSLTAPASISGALAFDTAYAAAAVGAQFKYMFHIASGLSELVVGVCSGAIQGTGAKTPIKHVDAATAETLYPMLAHGESGISAPVKPNAMSVTTAAPGF